MHGNFETHVEYIIQTTDVINVCDNSVFHLKSRCVKRVNTCSYLNRKQDSS